MTTTELTASSTTALMEKIALLDVRSNGNYISEVFKFPVLTEQEEYDLAVEYRDKGNQRAAWALICCHLRQVVAIARGYTGYGLPEADLIQEGNIGLMKAVKRFDPDRKVRLGTYASHWIKAAIGEYIIRNWKIIKVASTAAQRKLFYRLRTIAAKIGRRLNESDARQIAEELEVRSEDVLEMEKRMLLPAVPFESDSDDDDEGLDYSPSATLTADGGTHAEMITVENAVEEAKQKALAEAFASLNEREQHIVQARALSATGKDTKLHELAEELGISTERVRQLEKKAMAKIKDRVLEACAHLID